jgi:hypothetical protein
VDFFVAAGEEELRTGKFVERDIYSILTFAAAERDFVRAMPKVHKEGEEDLTIKARTALILAEYQKRRVWYIGPDKQDVVKVLRNWLSDGDFCRSPA